MSTHSGDKPERNINQKPAPTDEMLLGVQQTFPTTAGGPTFAEPVIIQRKLA